MSWTSFLACLEAEDLEGVKQVIIDARHQMPRQRVR